MDRQPLDPRGERCASLVLGPGVLLQLLLLQLLLLQLLLLPLLTVLLILVLFVLLVEPSPGGWRQALPQQPALEHVSHWRF